MQRESLLKKIKTLRMYGKMSIKIKMQDKFFEFKIINIIGFEYIAFDGYGLCLSAYIINKEIDYEKIIRNFEQALKGIDKTLKDLFLIIYYKNTSTSMRSIGGR